MTTKSKDIENQQQGGESALISTVLLGKIRKVRNTKDYENLDGFLPEGAGELIWEILDEIYEKETH